MSSSTRTVDESAAPARPVTKSIGRRILVRTLAVGLIPLLLLGLVVVFGLNSLNDTAATRADESRELLSQESVVVISEEHAVSVSREINVRLNERISDVQAWARSAEVIESAQSGEDEAKFYLRSELASNADFRGLTITNSAGLNVAFSEPTSDFTEAGDETWWNAAWTDGLHLSDVQYDPASGAFTVDVAVRIEDSLRSRLGVLQASLSIGFVQTIADERATDTVEYTVALGDGRLIAETETDHSSARMMGFSSSPGLEEALNQDFADTVGGALIDEDFVYGYATTLDPERFATVGSDDFAGYDWVIVSTQTAESAFAPLRGLEALKTDISDAGSNLQTLIIVFLLLGVAVALLMARQTAQGIVKPIQKLTDAATEAAETGLPWAVEEINSSSADLNSIKAPEVQIGTGDELQTLAGAFNSVQASALRLAAEQAKSRRNTAEMFVNLGRRNQSLLKRQLRFIDTLESNEQNPDTLESLFKLDHLATRMRRNAESLLVLAGDRSPRRWAKPIEVQSAIEAALAEVENYERVDFGRIDDGKIQGNIVADVAHILAEIIENGLNFSPPSAEVTVIGRNANDNYVVTVADAGLGIKPDEMERINEQLATVIEFTDVPSQQLGLFVVARLANRHGISVRLSNASSGGLSVRIEVPTASEPEPSNQGKKRKKGKKKSAKAAAVEAQKDEADSEVQELLAKAEAAVAKAAAIRADRDDDDLNDERERIARLRDEAEAASDDATSDDESSDDELAVSESSDDISSDDDSDEGDTVAVGEFSFPRRGGSKATPADAGEGEPKQQRRKSDPEDAEAAAVTEAPADLESFGFTRRESKKPVSKPKSGSRRKSDQGTPSASSEETDVVEVAEKSRSQWGSFQRGKAEAEGVDATSDSDDEQATAESAGNSAGKKEK